MIAESILHEFIHLVIMTLLVFCIPFLIRSFVPVKATRELVEVKKSKGRYVVFDILRGIAILGVILIHVGYLYTKFFHINNTSYIELIDATLRFSLPVFFITSGVLLKPVKRTITSYVVFLWGRVKKLLPLYILLTALLTYVAHGFAVRTFLQNIVTGEVSVPYYFMVILIQLYLLYPFIEQLSHKRTFVYGTLIFSVVLQLMPVTWHLFGVPLAFRFMFFFVWGIYMREQLLKGMLSRTLVQWFFIVVFFFALYAALPGQYYNMRPFYGVAVFSLLYLFFTRPHTGCLLERCLEKIGAMSYWIYLVHFPVMQVLFSAVAFQVDTDMSAVVLYALITIVSLLVSILSGWLVKIAYVSAQAVLLGK